MRKSLSQLVGFGTEGVVSTNKKILIYIFVVAALFLVGALMMALQVYKGGALMILGLYAGIGGPFLFVDFSPASPSTSIELDTYHHEHTCCPSHFRKVTVGKEVVYTRGCVTYRWIERWE